VKRFSRDAPIWGDSMDKKGRFEDLIAWQKEKLNCSSRNFT
jgi:hypothetical protein